MCAAEPVKADTYTRFLEAFQPYGLKSESFYVAYGLAENTLAVSLGGRTIISVNKRALALGKARMTTEVSEIDGDADCQLWHSAPGPRREDCRSGGARRSEPEAHR